ncbi:GGDEF domain-containing protein [Paenibacillus sp. PSB04]|uniref:GGDEF domain-containing protein n=1 Tax=Paenibacillus sp. PSB04 TaxID=2866810 RepID=UPI0021F207CA|nr:GGDEF domain-containing protein [Paenibacillus sp. PSB04]UYO04111.1 GGDEF domain-containing protein [Paenibacillus sp. PSB04]
MPYSSFLSPIVPGIAAASGLYIILIMLLICLTMYSRQRKKAYLYMVAAFLFIMAYEGVNIHFAFSGSLRQGNYPEGADWLQAFSLLLLNFAVYQLYHRMNRRLRALLIVMALLYVVPLLSPGFLEGAGSWQAGYIDLCQLGTVMIGLFGMAPRVGQRKKYTAGLAVYFIYISVHLLNNLIPLEKTWIPAIWIWLPLLFYTLLFFILFTRIVEQMQSIYRSSITDGLTNLYNRRFFTRQLNRYVDQGLKVSLIFCDIDNFKKLNDTEGHARADQVLKQVAAIIEEEVDETGLAGRYGGEELVALIVDKRAKVSRIAEQIRARVEAETIVTLSVGYSVLRAGTNAGTLISQADQAMYRSKTTGKNKVTAYRSSNPPAAAGTAPSAESANT